MTLNKAERARMLELNRIIKSLSLERLSYLKKLSADPEKGNKLTDLGIKLYLTILDLEIDVSGDNPLKLKEVILNTPNLTKDEKTYFSEYKNDTFYSQALLFDRYIEHPNQILLTKTKFLDRKAIYGKRLVQKQKTLNQVLQCLWDAKLTYFMIDQLKYLKKEVSKRKVLENINPKKMPKDQLPELINAKMKQVDIAKELNVSVTTVKRWVKELRSK